MKTLRRICSFLGSQIKNVFLLRIGLDFLFWDIARHSLSGKSIFWFNWFYLSFNYRLILGKLSVIIQIDIGKWGLTYFLSWLIVPLHTDCSLVLYLLNMLVPGRHLLLNHLLLNIFGGICPHLHTHLLSFTQSCLSTRSSNLLFWHSSFLFLDSWRVPWSRFRIEINFGFHILKLLKFEFL